MRILKKDQSLRPILLTHFKNFKNATTRKNTIFPNISTLEQVRSLGSPLLYPKLAKVPVSGVDSQDREYPSSTSTKPSLQKCVCVASNFIVLISSRSFRQMLDNFSEVKF